MEIKGTVKVIGETQVISDKFKKRDIVVTTENGEYTQHISLQLVNDKCSLADKLVIGAEATFSINLRGREWTSPKGEVKYFNTIECWKIDNVSVGQFQGADNASNPLHAPAFSTTAQEDDLPF